MNIDIDQFLTITVTPEDIVAYYTKAGIKDYPKNANGMPNMKTNKTACKIIYEEKHQALIAKLGEKCRTQKIEEMIGLRTEKSIGEDCPICLEPMNSGRSILNCSHVFCIECSITHFREHQNCPLCRADVCPPKKTDIIPITDTTTHAIVDTNLGYVFPERQNFDLYNFILTSTILFRDSEQADAFRFTDEIFDEVRRFGHDVASDVKSWYEN